MMNLKAIAIVSLLLSSYALAEESIVAKLILATLESTRPKLKHSDLSLDEKRTIVDQAQLVLSKIYVNKENKNKLYGFNPDRDFEKLKRDLDSISIEDFHTRMLEVFNSAKDYHVNYYLPSPHVCYITKLPINLYLTKNNKYVVRTIFKEHMQLAPELSQLSLADEVLKYDGQSVHQRVEEFSKTVNASTTSSRRRAAEVFLTWRDASADPIPAANEVVLQIKKASGDIQNVSLPWITEGEKKCIEIEEKSKVEDKKSSIGSRKFLKNGINREERLSRYLKSTEKSWSTFKDSFQLNFGRFHSFKEDFVDLKVLSKTEDDDIQWKTFNFQDKQIAYLKISSFNTFDMSSFKAAKRLQKIIEANLANTDALIIDLRSNLGGQIDYAEYAASLFHPNPLKAFPFMVRANEDVLSIFKGENTWEQLINQNIGKNKYAGPGNISEYSERQFLSQAYFGRVVLLTNAYCFSSCEIFAAAMKEFAGAKIYGLHKSTFGGGANVWSSEYFAEAFAKNSLPVKVPQALSFRATVRHGILPSDKSIIDDVGVLSDYIIPLEISEIVEPRHSSTIYQIAKDLVTTKFLEKSSDYSLDQLTKLSRIKDTNELVGEYQSLKIDELYVYKDKQFLGKFEKNDQGKFQIRFVDNSSTENSSYFAYSIYGYESTILRKKLKNRISAIVMNK